MRLATIRHTAAILHCSVFNITHMYIHTYACKYVTHTHPHTHPHTHTHTPTPTVCNGVIIHYCLSVVGILVRLGVSACVIN